jgi:hypothetical protein
VARKIPEALIDHAAERIAAGATLREAAIGVCNPDELSKRLRARGIVIDRGGRAAPNRLILPEEEIISAYLKGESELALAKRFVVSRQAIMNLLTRASVERRGGSESMRLRMARATSDERRALVAKARETRAANLAKCAAKIVCGDRRSCKREALRGPDPACDGCAGFTIAFDPSLTPEQVKGVLTALADYYRACGGAGFAVEVAS